MPPSREGVNAPIDSFPAAVGFPPSRTGSAKPVFVVPGVKRPGIDASRLVILNPFGDPGAAGYEKRWPVATAGSGIKGVGRRHGICVLRAHARQGRRNYHVFCAQ
jgi:hypothetical protein